jgi:rSAM/selenodomain-associated transferase 2
MTISVIIPVLNEQQALPAAIAALRSCRGIAEIVVADGGSTDGTLEWLRHGPLCESPESAGPQLALVNSVRGKGPQINAGAAKASGDVLLFLHADCTISQPALDALGLALADEQVAGGAFCMRFAEARPRSLRLVAAGINLRARLRRSATGDQGIFVRKKVFEAVGGAPDWPLFEDVELVRRIKKAGKFLVLKAAITTSARRYVRQGVLRTALLIYTLRLAHWLGVSPEKLKGWFGDVRPGMGC